MGLSDHEHINFSQDHELNYHLRKVDKRETQKNRDELVVMGNELKDDLDARFLKHGEFHEYVVANKDRLE